jgi:hypothetical protein
MTRTGEPVGWRSFEWAVTALLTICAALLAVCASLMWSYLPATSTTANNSSSVTKDQTETEAVLSGLKEQQALTNSKLDAIRDARPKPESSRGCQHSAPFHTIGASL